MPKLLTNPLTNTSKLSSQTPLQQFLHHSILPFAPFSDSVMPKADSPRSRLPPAAKARFQDALGMGRLRRNDENKVPPGLSKSRLNSTRKRVKSANLKDFESKNGRSRRQLRPPLVDVTTTRSQPQETKDQTVTITASKAGASGEGKIKASLERGLQKLEKLAADFERSRNEIAREFQELQEAITEYTTAFDAVAIDYHCAVQAVDEEKETAYNYETMYRNSQKELMLLHLRVPEDDQYIAYSQVR
ncbi:hypothetical protein DFP72DRAFT_1084755 [Ephemerocybe angulata]|uniref:Uncharacterized protein n=1 Tax=Ephemerocybe angulata TaxID=980116 RepID=A0A8H6LRL9_9AGAR|nr:hypothetical protein DFP72DRAFT_1084755 [Tulosesus angulatus]